MGRWKNYFWMGTVCFVVVTTSSGADVGNLKIRARAGDAEAQEKLAVQYEGSFQYIKAYNWFSKAAKAGRAEAQYRLGLFQLKGKPKFGGGSGPIPANPTRGLYWLKTAAAQDHAGAQGQLARCYEEGVGVQLNFAEAYKWALVAAEKSVVYGVHANRLALKLSPSQVQRGKQLAVDYLAGLKQQKPKSLASYIVTPQTDLHLPVIVSNHSIAPTPVPPPPAKIQNRNTPRSSTSNTAGNVKTSSSLPGILGTILKVFATIGVVTIAIVFIGLLLSVTFVLLLIRSFRSKPNVPVFPSAMKESARESHRQHAPATASFLEIDWFQFEKLMELVYSKEGYRVERRGGANPDGGIDLVLERGIDRIAVQCKHWKTQQAGVKVVREFLGAMTAERFGSGIFVITNQITEEARDLAQKNNIKLLDRNGLNSLMARHDVAYDPEFTALLAGEDKHCPKCESKMVQRVSKKGSSVGETFWGCSTFPKCRYVMKIKKETVPSRQFVEVPA